MAKNTLDITINLEIGKRLKLARQGIKVSQLAVSVEVGLSCASIINMEKGRQSMSAATIYRISNFLGVSVASLLPSVDDPISPVEQRKLIAAFRMIERSSGICAGILNSDKEI